jgi:hypothetical protein
MQGNQTSLKSVFLHLLPQVAQVFGYALSVYVEGQLEEAAEGEEQDQLLQPLPLGPLQVNLTAAAARLSGGRARAAANGGSGGLLSTAQKVGQKGACAATVIGRSHIHTSVELHTVFLLHCSLPPPLPSPPPHTQCLPHS